MLQAERPSRYVQVMRAPSSLHTGLNLQGLMVYGESMTTISYRSSSTQHSRGRLLDQLIDVSWATLHQR